MPTFIGFHSPSIGPMQVLYDVELVKQDLINQFNTQKGERIMDADYGFIGWDLIFELKHPGTKAKLEADARRIIASDPRVEIRTFAIIEHDNGFSLDILLSFVVLNKVDTLVINFDKESASDQL